VEFVDSSPDVLVLGGQFKKDGTVVSRRKERASVVYVRKSPEGQNQA